jgi:hypothetical protein
MLEVRARLLARQLRNRNMNAQDEQVLQQEITRRMAFRRPPMLRGPWYEYSRERGCVNQYLVIALVSAALAAVLVF